MMLEVLDSNRRKVAYLENAYNIKETLKINSINILNFTMPDADEKIKYLNPFTYIKTKFGLYRILPKKVKVGEMGSIDFECEHVIATLIDNVIFGSVIYGNLGIHTKQVINFILNKQKTKNWVLKECDFDRQFEYAWENETLATALWSIPKPLEDDYIWIFNTNVYPWEISLKKINKSSLPSLYIMPKKNQISLEATSDVRQLFTRIYPLGYGEGVNQLNISDVNNGKTYIDAEPEFINKYGLIERIWIDRRYENAQSLKDAATTMLNEFKEPTLEFNVDFALFENDKFNVGDKVEVRRGNKKFHDFITQIQYDYDDITKSKITVSNKSKDIASTVADMADRQRIEMSYSQGATQVYAQSVQANADNRDGAELNFFIPSEMRIINKVLLKIKVDAFRAYSKAVKGGGGSTETTMSGGGDETSTSAGGGDYVGGATFAGGGISETTHGEADVIGGNIYRTVTNFQGIAIGRAEDYHVEHHEHRVYIRDHSHEVRINIPNHTHLLSIRPHSHSYTLPNHTHEIEYGIFRKYEQVNYFTLKINGKSIKTFNDTNAEIDITDYLLNKEKRISRGTWHRVEVVPNGLAHINIDMMLQGFVQSRGDYTV